MQILIFTMFLSPCGFYILKLIDDRICNKQGCGFVRVYKKKFE